MYSFLLSSGVAVPQSQQILVPNPNRVFLAIGQSTQLVLSNLGVSFSPGPLVPTDLDLNIDGSRFMRIGIKTLAPLQPLPGFNDSRLYVFETVPTGFVTVGNIANFGLQRGTLFEGVRV